MAENIIREDKYGAGADNVFIVFNDTVDYVKSMIPAGVEIPSYGGNAEIGELAIKNKEGGWLIKIQCFDFHSGKLHAQLTSPAGVHYSKPTPVHSLSIVDDACCAINLLYPLTDQQLQQYAVPETDVPTS